MILGEMAEGNKLYGTGTICMPTDGDLVHKLNEAVSNIHAEFTAVKSEIEPLQNSTIMPQSDLRNYSIFSQNNDIYYLENDNITCFSDIWGKKYNEKTLKEQNYILKSGIPLEIYLLFNKKMNLMLMIKFMICKLN